MSWLIGIGMVCLTALIIAMLKYGAEPEEDSVPEPAPLRRRRRRGGGGGA